MTEHATPDDSPTIGRRDGALVGAASVLSAAVAFIILLLAPRLLTLDENTVFQTFWAALFAIFGVLTGISIEMTRAVTTGLETRTNEGPRVRTLGISLALVTTTTVLLSSPLWYPLLFGDLEGSSVWLAVLVGLGAGAFALHSTVVGALAGVRNWSTYSAVIAADSGVRLVIVVSAGLAGFTVLGMAGGAALATFTCVLFYALSRDVRHALLSRVDETTWLFLNRLGAALLAQGSSALLVVGFPVILRLTTPADEYMLAAPLLLAIALTRAPLLVPLNAYQGVAISHFVRQRDKGIRAITPMLGVIGVIGALGAGTAWLIGPALLVFLTGDPEYHLPGSTLGGLTLGAAFIAALTLTGALCQALKLHRAYLAGWLAATTSAILLLTLSGSIEQRTILALVGGPVVGILVHIMSLIHNQQAGVEQS